MGSLWTRDKLIPIDNNEGIAFKVKLGAKESFGTCQSDKFDPIKRLILLSVIPLSGAHCNKKILSLLFKNDHLLDHIRTRQSEQERTSS